MANITGASLTPILQRLNNTESYHPLEAETFADWSVEAGDVVTVSRDGTDYSSPVHSSKISWRKGQQVTLSSTGNEERDSIAKLSQKKYTTGGGGGGNLRDTMYQHIYVEDVYNQLKSGLELTTSSATLYVQDAYKQLASGLKLTSSSAAMYVNDSYKQLSSGLRMTSSSINLTVKNNYNGLSSSISQNARNISLVVKNGKVNAAEMVAGINGPGGSFVRIQAEKINLSGYVTAKQLSAVEAEIQNLKSTLASAKILRTNALIIRNTRTVRIVPITIDGVSHEFLVV